jgi:hypothetical protein
MSNPEADPGIGIKMDHQTRHDHQSSLVYLLLYHNLGGELIYILNQRLIAQKISKDKADKVLVDVITNLVHSRNYWLRTFESCSDRVLDSLTLKIPFQSVISSSPIMKLTASSYDKLYDLMVGVFKWQLCQAPLPSSLYYISLNHINSILDLCSDIGPGIRNVVKGMQLVFAAKFSHLTKYQWSILRDIILSNFLINVKTRVSILIREKKQDMETGCYVIPLPTPSSSGSMFNGRITHFGDDGHVIREDGIFCEGVSEMTSLGLDIYSTESEEKIDSRDKDKDFQVNGGREANLLANLLGAAGRDRPASSTFALDFEFDEESNSESATRRSDSSRVKEEQESLIPSRTVRTERFDIENSDYDADDPVDGDELLALMDS